MSPGKGKAAALAAAVLGVATAIGAGGAIRGRVREEWYLRKLKSSADGERREAAERLGEMGSERAVPFLLGLLRKSPADPPEYCTEALVKIGSPAAPGLVRMLKQEQLSTVASRLLTKIGAPAVGPLSRALRDECREVGWHAADALGAIGPPARAGVPALLEALRDDDARNYVLRLCALQALGRIGPDAAEAVPALEDALEDPDAGFRQRAAEALERIRPERPGIQATPVPPSGEPPLETLGPEIPLRSPEAVIRIDGESLAPGAEE